MTSFFRKLVLIGFLLVSSFRASAEITIFDGYFMDTVSDLDWRVMASDTRSWSYSFVNDNFDAGEKFEGWRYATDLEFLALVQNVGGSEVTDYSNTLLIEDAAEHSIADDLIDYFSPAVSQSNSRWTYGMLLQDGSSEVWVTQVSDRDNPNTEDRVYIRSNGAGVSSGDIGSFLVRTAVSPN